MMDADAQRLRKRITDYLNGDYPRPAGETFRKDGVASKHDTCAHGLAMYECCENCIDAYFQAVLDER
jgi:hypothetical protein